MPNFDPSIFRHYDIRGLYPSQYNQEIAYLAGQAFVQVRGAKRIVAGRDVRTMAPSVQEAAIQGALDAGADVIQLGVISTEMLYFAAATLDCDGGLSVTASHNGREWIGTKFIGKGAVPLTFDLGLKELYTYINTHEPFKADHPGSLTEHNILADYLQYLKQFNPSPLPSAKIVANVNFGANGKIIDGALADWPVNLVRLNWEENGEFPKGKPDPSLPANRKEIAEAIVAAQADFGVAFDADADRCFLYDEKGRYFHAYYLACLLMEQYLKQEPGATVIGLNSLNRAHKAITQELGGKLVISTTGNVNVKHALRENQAVFGAETSGHFYFRDFFYNDNGMVLFMTAAQIFSHKLQTGQKVSALLDHYLELYPAMQSERNYVSEQASEVIAKVQAHYADAIQNQEDGATIDYPTWHCNLRGSNTEPIIRMNIEAATELELEQRIKELDQLVSQLGAQLRDDN